MSIHDYISDDLIIKIVEIIKTACEEAHNNVIEWENKVSIEEYESIKKGRKAHDITGEIYLYLISEKNQIDGINIDIVKNGIYSQPELRNENVVIHIYHDSNKLDSKLVLQRKIEEKAFFCIMYSHDKAYRLIKVYVVDNATGQNETLYKRPKLKMVV